MKDERIALVAGYFVMLIDDRGRPFPLVTSDGPADIRLFETEDDAEEAADAARNGRWFRVYQWEP